MLIFLDEFDRIGDVGTRLLMADTIKTLSDQLVKATLVIVGVADDVESLISEHESIERAIAQIRMPRMRSEEIADIIDKGLDAVEMTIDPEARTFLVRIPQGLPTYAHLIAQCAAKVAVREGATNIDQRHVASALSAAIEKSQASIRTAYHDATSSAQKSLYEEVLLACALAPVDSLGYFAPADVRAPMTRIMDEKYDIPRFQNHLYDFCTTRGPVLERRGGERRWRYRFANPLMQPFVVLKGLHEGRILMMDIPESPMAL